ncbi:MAG: hypothetical protein RQ783_09605 [Gammaproteobacteria bacterium]|nr:hypothetical protein [Gammaproteobacteria bacterium]
MKYTPVLKTYLERIESATKGKSLTAQRYAMEVRRMAGAVEALERLAVSRNPKETEEFHAVKVAAAAKRLAADVAKTNERLNNTFRDSVAILDAQIRQQSGMIPNQYANEIRQALRSMNQKKRNEALQKALKDGDSETLSAIQDAPEVVTGIQLEFRDQLVEGIRRQKAPELYSEFENNSDSFSTALAALGSVNKAISEGFDPKKLAEIEAAETRHMEAQNALNSSMVEPSNG